MTALLTRPAATTRRPAAAEALIERSAPQRSTLDVEAIIGLTNDLIGHSKKYRPERAKAVRELLVWLDTFPGSDWHQRWRATGSDGLGEMWGPQGPRGMAHPVAKSGVNALIALEVIRPTVGWLREATPPHLFTRCREVMEPEAFEKLGAMAETFPVARTARMLAINMLTILRIHIGHTIMNATAADVGEVVQAWRASGRMIHSVPLAWKVLQETGGLRGEASDFRSLTLAGPKTVAELVDSRGVRSAPIKALLTDYLSERAASVDYPTLVGLSRMLVKHFWVDIEEHAHEQTDLRLTAEVAKAWKTRLRHLPDGRERADYFTHLMAVRSFYLDIAQWALTDPSRWAQWVSICPIGAEETAGARKRLHRRRARMHQRTRTLAPLLPDLVSQAERHKRWAADIFTQAASVPEGQEFEFEGARYRRVIRRSCYSDGAARPSVVELAGGKTLRLHHIEELAFWTWAVIEVFRHTGSSTGGAAGTHPLVHTSLHRADRRADCSPANRPIEVGPRTGTPRRP